MPKLLDSIVGSCQVLQHHVGRSFSGVCQWFEMSPRVLGLMEWVVYRMLREL